MATKPAEFKKCLLSWITALHEISDGKIVAIDGKQVRAAGARMKATGAQQPRGFDAA